MTPTSAGTSSSGFSAATQQDETSAPGDKYENTSTIAIFVTLGFIGTVYVYLNSLDCVEHRGVESLRRHVFGVSPHYLLRIHVRL